MAGTMLRGGNRLVNHVFKPRYNALKVHVANKRSFLDTDIHSGYGVEKEPSTAEHYKRGKGMLLNEFKTLCRELLNRGNYNLGRMHGDYLYQWKFDNQEVIDDWVVTADNDNLEGYSHNEFVLSKNKTGLWRGYVDTEVPKSGYLHKTGYCNITSPYNYVSSIT